MRTYEVINRPLRRNDRTYAIGSAMRLDDANAEILLRRERVKEKAVEKVATAPRQRTSTRTPRKTAVKK